MTRSHWRESIKSLGSHIDPEKEEQLRKTKIEIDNKVARIMKLIKNKNQGKKDGNPAKNSELVELIEDFHKQYQELYALYGNLRDDVREKVQSKEHKEGSSSTSSSDTESYHSLDEASSRSSSRTDLSQRARDDFKLKLETSSSEITDLRNKLTAMIKEKEDLHSEHMATLSKIQESKKIIEGLRTEADRTERTKQKLLNECTQLKEKLVEKEKELFSLSRLHESTVPTQIKVLEREVSSLKLELKKLGTQKTVLEQQIGGRETNSKHLIEENLGLRARILQLERKSLEREDELSSLSRKLEENESKSMSKTEELMANANNLQLEINTLRTQKCDLEEQVVFKSNEATSQVKGVMDQVNVLQQELHSLSSQKSESETRIRVAEQLHVENKDVYGKTKEKYEQEHMDLKERVVSTEIAMKRMKDISLTANDMLTGLDTAALKFEECSGNFLNRISKSSCEVLFAKDWVRRKNNAIKHVQEDLDCLLVQLDTKEVEILGFREKVKMRKHQLRESIKSFFGSHVDPEKDEELKGTKTEIEDKVQKILNLIKEEDEDEKGGNTVGKSKKEPLVELIEDFHKHYQSLYARYDHLTGELREKVHGKQEKDTFSSSGSDSDSDYSSKEKGSKNGKLQNEFQKVTDDIKQELQSAHLEVADLKRKLTETTEEKEALHLEYQTALNKIQEAEKMISDLKMEAEMLNGENSKLLLEIRDLNQRLDGASMLEAELNQKLEDITRERTDLLVEKETALQRIKEGEKITEELKVVTNQLNDEKKTLQLELEDLKGILCTTKDQLECSEQEVANLIRAQKATEEQNSSLSSKILELSSEINGAQDKIQELVTKSSWLREKLGEREKELVSHTEMHETHKSETSARMRGLELELDSLHTQKGEIEKQKADELSSLLKKLEEKEKDSLSQIEDMTTWINNLQLVLEVETLQTQKSKLEEQLVRDSNEASGQVKGLLDKVNEKQQELETLNSQKIEFESQLEKKILEMSEYLVRIGTLEEESEKNIADQQKMLEEKEGLMVQVKDLERELDSLQNQNSNLEEQLRTPVIEPKTSSNRTVTDGERREPQEERR
ncbi:COP1-interactive protein 1 [Camellia lanceoleosa]|uniref:COP1-interactive protein 1 n=1 Tax=Camellia lanceoleosa TaxID=1840588 RepID=A0ACC0FXK5_9ERIC|nr:COP1-interactive protein 1 [Camellia lanceoleosa]